MAETYFFSILMAKRGGSTTKSRNVQNQCL